MKNKSKAELSLIVILILIIGIMTVGFAAYSSVLNIGSSNNVTVKPASWNVHFDTESYAEGTNSVEAATHSVTDTAYSFTVTLEKPGDFYEATVVVENEGLLDAKLIALTMSELSTAQQNYLKYTVTYGGTEYTASASNLAIDLAKTTGTANVKVRLDYIAPDDPTLLPQTEQTVTITGSLSYEPK